MRRHFIFIEVNIKGNIEKLKTALRNCIGSIKELAHNPKQLKQKCLEQWKNVRNSLFTILDWYIIRKFLGSYVFSIILLLAIVIVFDIN